tara:strand:+ start:50 stop:562 length:513 start_codon:yes stop_codon:yes gene_type:complete
MEITINNLKYKDPDETVIEVGWGASIWETVDGKTYSAAVSGTQELERDGDSPTFIPYDDLTEDVVMQWLRDSLDEDLAIKAVAAADAIEAVEGVEAVEAVEAVEEVVDDDGNVITEAVEAVEAVEGVEEVEAVDAVEEVVGVAGLTVLENQIEGYIAEQKNPQVEKGLPW